MYIYTGNSKGKKINVNLSNWEEVGKEKVKTHKTIILNIKQEIRWQNSSNNSDYVK